MALTIATGTIILTAVAFVLGWLLGGRNTYEAISRARQDGWDVGYMARARDEERVG